MATGPRSGDVVWRAPADRRVRGLVIGAFLGMILVGSWLTARWIFQSQPMAAISVPAPTPMSTPSSTPFSTPSTGGSRIVAPFAGGSASSPASEPLVGRSPAGRAVPQARVVFAGSAMTLTPAARSALDEVATYLRSSPTSFVIVLRHTDSRGYTSAKQQAALNRAHVVVHYLSDHGVPEARISHTAFSDDASPPPGTATGAVPGKGRVEVVVRDLGQQP